MTEQTKTLPTPATDALRASERALESIRVGFYIEEGSRLEATLSAAEAIEEALKAEPWLQKSKVPSKKVALRILLKKAWQETDDFKAHRALEKEAGKERRILTNIESADAAVEAAQKRLIEKAGNVHDTRGILDATAYLRETTVQQENWQSVKYIVEHFEKSPVEALEIKVKEETKALLSTHRHRATSRSTSVFSNLLEDMDNEITASWLEDANRILGAFFF